MPADRAVAGSSTGEISRRPVASSLAGVPQIDGIERPWSWRVGPLLAWTTVLFGGLLLAAFAAPFVYVALGALPFAADWPYSRVFNRTAMVVAALLIYVFRDSVGWRFLSLLYAARTAGSALLQVTAGFAAALAGTACVVAGAFAFGWLGAAKAPYSLLEPRTATTLAGALVVALVEETFFRGLVFPSLMARVGARIAAIASSAVYALVHLLVSDRSLGRRDFSLDAGFGYLFRAIGRQLEPASLLPLCGMFLCGLILAAVVRRSGTLYLAIGMHAAWAAAFQILRHATRPLVAIPGSSFLATHHYLVGTPWAWAGVVLSGLLAIHGYERLARRANRLAAAGRAPGPRGGSRWLSATP